MQVCKRGGWKHRRQRLGHAGVGRLSPVGHNLVPFHPARAFLHLRLILWPPRPHPVVDHLPALPLGCHRQGRMHVQPVLGLVTQPPQPRDPRLGREIQLGRILDTQDERISPAYAPQSARDEPPEPPARPTHRCLTAGRPPWSPPSPRSPVGCFPSAAPTDHPPV